MALVGASGLHSPHAVGYAPAAGVTPVTVYSSMPLDIIDVGQTADAVRGEKLALAQAGNTAGECRIVYRSLDDSTAVAEQWDPFQTAANARAAAYDSSTIAYLGEFNSGASAVSIPILNRAGIPQISPSNTALELTKYPGRRGHGAPAKYYPTGKRTYARVAVADHVQAGALAEWMKALHVRRLYVAHDGYTWGGGIARMMTAAARLNGIHVVATKTVRRWAPHYGALARKVKASRADAFFYGGLTQSHAARVYSEVYATNPGLKLFGPDGVVEALFVRHLARSARPHMHMTAGDIPPRDYMPKGRQFVRAFARAYGRRPAEYAIYGYETMSLLLNAMQRAGAACGDRSAVLGQIFATRNRDSVLGVYSIDKDGDTTLNRVSRYVIRNGRLTYDKAVVVQRDAYGNSLGRTRDARASSSVPPLGIGLDTALARLTGPNRAAPTVRAAGPGRPPGKVALNDA
jgi:branched-chain amino acid transport system substrate-binding protein